jgi:hypothetical protein
MSRLQTQHETKQGVIVGKGIRGGIVVGVAVLLAAFLYSGVYFSSQPANLEGDGLVVVIILACSCVVAVLLVAAWRQEQVREEYLRKFYLSGDTLFNFEFGAKPIAGTLYSKDAPGLVNYLECALAGLTYDSGPLNPPAGFMPTYCVSSDRFKTGNSGQEWRGNLQRIQQHEDGRRTYVNIAAFHNASELEQAIAKHVSL